MEKELKSLKEENSCLIKEHKLREQKLKETCDEIQN
jgi:hypothetical protein